MKKSDTKAKNRECCRDNIVNDSHEKIWKMRPYEALIAKIGVDIAKNGPIFNFVQGNQNEINISILSLLTVLSALVATTCLLKSFEHRKRNRGKLLVQEALHPRVAGSRALVPTA